MSSSGIGLDWIFECKPCGFALQTDIYSDFEGIGEPNFTWLCINITSLTHQTKFGLLSLIDLYWTQIDTESYYEARYSDIF